MNKPGNSLALLLAFGVLAALGMLVFWFFQDAYRFLQNLDHKTLAILTVALISAIYIGLSIRRAGQVHGIQHLRLEQKAQCYGRFLQAWSRQWVRDPTEVAAETSSREELGAATEQLLLWASGEVIKQLAGLQNSTASGLASDGNVLTVMEPVIRAMRSDLGQNNLSLKPGDIASIIR